MRSDRAFFFLIFFRCVRMSVDRSQALVPASRSLLIPAVGFLFCWKEGSYCSYKTLAHSPKVARDTEIDASIQIIRSVDPKE